ncbi:MAG: hypothetical protein KAI73_11775 [Rhodospirillaceae bacterium]|nr:hypothetical protein [Rhodospirillaceae bacterium]
MSNNNAFSKEEIVFFEQVLEGFNPNNITARQVMKYQPPSTTLERSALTVHRPIPYISVNKDGLTLVDADYAATTQLTVPSTLNANDSAPSDFKNVPFTMNAVQLNDPQQRDRKAESAVQALSALADKVVATEVANKGTIFIKDAAALTTYSQLANAEEQMSIRDVPIMAPRTLIMNPSDYNGVAGDLAQRAAVPEGVSLTAFERSKIPMVATFESFKANFMPTNVFTAASGWLVDGAQFAVPTSTDGNGNNVDNRTMTLTVDTGSGTVKLGDAFTIAGVNSLGTIHKNDTGQLQTFRVIARNSATEWEISPAIFTNAASGGSSQAELEYANCSIAAPNDAAITFLNITASKPSNIFFQNEAVEIVHGSLATMDLDGAGVSTMTQATDSGIEILFAKSSEINDLGTQYRLTMWMAGNVLIPDMCGNIIGT